ncbi:MAG: choice-of-anchor J domain-containing protein [Prevotella sp.]|nr:choice-of-anchor J domain-containing protein [Prevotella sp.]
MCFLSLSVAVMGSAQLMQKPQAGLDRLTRSDEVSVTYPLLNTVVRSQRSMKTMPRFAAMKGYSPVVAKAGESDDVQLQANMIYSSAWGDYDQPGIFTFTPAADAFTKVYSAYGLSANGGGAFIDGKFHYIFFSSYGGEVYPSYYCLDMATKSFTVRAQSVKWQGMRLISGSGVAYDASTGMAYGQFLSEDGQAYEFGAIDYSTLTRTTVCQMSLRLVTMSIDANGQLYSIATDGNLYTVDKMTGELTLVGNTGVQPTTNMQSAAFDPQTGQLYWAAIHDDAASSLYHVDPATAQTVKLLDYADGNELLALQVLPGETALQVPSAVSDLSLTVDAADLNQVCVQFTMPTTTAGGSVLQEGELNYSILVDGRLQTSGSAAAGAATEAVFTLATGSHVVAVCVGNDKGRSEYARATVYAGHDEPMAPTEVQLVVDADTHLAHLSWTAPGTEGVHQGVIQPAQLRYRVSRFPGNVDMGTVDTTEFEEELSSDVLTLYYYTVTAVNGDAESQPAKSNSVALGQYLETPWTEAFDNDDALQLFTIIDSNGDGSTWAMSAEHSVFYKYNWRNDADDWLLTPPIRLSADRRYTFSLKAKSSARYTESFEVKIGQGDDPATFDELMPKQDVLTADFITLEQPVQVDANGAYRLAIHCVSSKTDTYQLFIDDLAIDEGMLLTAPDSVTSMQLSSTTPGEASATLTFTAPAVDLKGDPIDVLQRIEVYRGEELVETLADVAAGSRQTVVDAQAANGFNTYTVVAYNESGRGGKASVTAFIGTDTPDYPHNPAITDDGNGEVTITWEAVGTTGVNGGYVDPAKVVYDVFNVENGEVADLLASVEGQTSVTLTDIDVEGEADSRSFAIAARTVNGYSSAVAVSLTVGSPQALPFHESVKGGDVENTTWFLSGTSRSSFAVYNYAVDGDGGSLRWLTQTDDEDATLSTCKLTLADAQNPKLTFYYYMAPGRDVELDVDVDCAQKNGTVTLLQLKHSEFTEEGWAQAVVDLSGVKSEPYVIIRFHAISRQQRVPVIIDNINIYDVLPIDLTASVKAPASGMVGEEQTVSVAVQNMGQELAEGYVVSLYAADRLVGQTTADEPLGAYGAEAVFDFTFTPLVTDGDAISLKAVVEHAADGNADNDEALATMAISQNDVPAPQNLMALDAEGTTRLTWDAPQIPAEGPEVTEDFESYLPFVIDECGDWKCIDMDKAATGGLDMENAGMENGLPMAFFVMNPDEAYYYSFYAPFATPHGGDQYLASFSAENGDAGSDDWLISPALDCSAQTVRFFAKSTQDYYNHEQLLLLYSTTDRSPASFRQVEGTDTIEVPSSWTEFEMQLPQGARYFAIHKVSHDSFVLMIDDITYRAGKGGAGLVVTAYNVYRDGQLIATVDAADTAYTDTTAGEGTHTYGVTALYGTTESALSNAVEGVTTGIKPAAEHTLRAASAVYDLQGRRVSAMRSPGLYISGGRKVRSEKH